MTPEELVRHYNARFNENGIEAMAPFWHPEVDYREDPAFPGAGSYHGREAVVARFGEYVEALGVTRADVERVVSRGDRVAWTVRVTGRSPEGVPNAHTWGYSAHVEDEMIAKCVAYYDADKALEALEAAD